MSAAYHAVGKAIGTEDAVDKEDLKSTDFSKGEAAAAFDQTKYAADKNALLQQQMAAATARTGPVSTAAQGDIGAVAQLQYGGAQVDRAAQMTAANSGAYQAGQAAQLGPAAQSAGSTINRQDEQFRNAQLGLQSQLQDQAAGRGPSLAAGQLREATDRNIANQAGLAASQGGRNAGTAQRSLALGAAGMNQQAGRDAAQMRMQEQLSAQSQLAGLTSAGRGADINVNSQQAGLNQSNNQFNAGAQNQFGLQQGQFSQQANMMNAQNQLQNQQFNAQMLQQAGLSNQSAVNQRAAQQASLLQQAGLASSAAQTQTYGQNTANQQQTNLANQGASLQQQQMNDAMQKYLTEAGLGVDTRSQEAAMAKQGLILNQNAGENKMAQSGAEASSDRFGGFLKSAASYAAMSDENVKSGVTSGNSRVKSMMNQYMSEGGAESESFKDPKAHGGAFGGGLGGADKGADDRLASAAKGIGGGSAPADPSASLSAAPTGVDPNMAVAMPESDRNVKMNIDNPGDRGFLPIGGDSRMDGDTGRGFKPEAPKGTLESWSDKQKEKQGGEGADGGEAREGDGDEDVKEKPASKPAPAPKAERKMTYDEMVKTANAMKAQTAANGEMLKDGPSAVGGPERQTKWLDDYMAKDKETSDEKAKDQIHDADSKIADFLNKIHAHSYEYKPGFKDPAKGGGEGTFVSPMAQEFEKSELGAKMVQKDAQGIRHVDYDRGHENGTFSAALAYLNEQLKKKKDK